MRILMIEDDPSVADYVQRGLTEQGHACAVLAEGPHGLFQATRETYDVLVVDRMIPGVDGLSLVRALRAAKRRTPVLFLTALGGIDDRVEGLEAGGDDYLTKPFRMEELNARVREVKTVLRVADLELDLMRRTASRAGRAIDLRPKEFTLLEVLMRNEGRMVTRTMLLERVWDFHFDPKTSVVETHISRLRAKVDKPFGAALLHTIKNMGYSLHAPR